MAATIFASFEQTPNLQSTDSSSTFAPTFFLEVLPLQNVAS